MRSLVHTLSCMRLRATPRPTAFAFSRSSFRFLLCRFGGFLLALGGPLALWPFGGGDFESARSLGSLLLSGGMGPMDRFSHLANVLSSFAFGSNRVGVDLA